MRPRQWVVLTPVVAYTSLSAKRLNSIHAHTPSHVSACTHARKCKRHHPNRPREKVNRPQTRRRRDNPEECVDKLRQMGDNIRGALGIVCEIIRRERRKRDLMHTEVCVGGGVFCVMCVCVFGVCRGGLPTTSKPTAQPATPQKQQVELQRIRVRQRHDPRNNGGMEDAAQLGMAQLKARNSKNRELDVL